MPDGFDVTLMRDVKAFTLRVITVDSPSESVAIDVIL